MYSIGEIFDYIGRTNLFNFVIFIAVIIWVCIKINVSGKLDSARTSVIDDIENSKTAKADSEDELKKIQESVTHIEEEIAAIIKKAKENAKMVGDKILEDAGITAESVKENSSKAIEAKAGLLKNDIIRRVSIASVEVAKNQIINELRSNPDLHNKLIDESIDAINGVVRQ